MSLTGKASASKLLRGKINKIDVIYTDTYEIAVKNGFEGTIDEWLASLKGDKGDKGDTPVRGTDYWTEEDKAEVVKEAKEGAIGDIETALDGILAIQNELIGGD